MKLTIQQSLQQGAAAYKEGKLQVAERIYRAILEARPKHPEANHNLGMIMASTSKFGEALPFFQTAANSNPKNEQFWISYIEALIKGNRFKDAKLILKQGKKNGLSQYKYNTLSKLIPSATEKKALPSQSEINVLLDHYQNWRLDKAEELATSLTKRYPRHSIGWKVLGGIYQQTGLATDALTVCKKVIEIDSKDAGAHNNYGTALQKLQRLKEAEASFRNAIKLKPDFAEAFSNLGNTLQELVRYEESEESYREAIKLQPGIAEVHNNLGNTLTELCRAEEAEANYTKAIELKPDYAEAHYNLGITLEKLDRFNDAENSFRRAIELKPDYAEAHNNLGSTLHKLGKLDETLKSYRQATTLKSDFAEAHLNLGNTLRELGRLDEAVLSFQQAFASRSGIVPMGDKKLSPATTSLFFELTNKCNFHCDFCPSDSQKRDLGSMDLELIKRLYEETANKNIAYDVNLHLMGEPTLHPDLIEILKFSASKNVKTHLVTNGSTLVKKNVPKLLDALYGTITASHMTPTKETYHFRGKVGLSWDRYINNLRLLVREYMKRLAKGKEIKNNVLIRVMATQNTASNVSILETAKEAQTILKEWNDYVSEIEKELGMTPFKRTDHNNDDLIRGNNHASTSYPLQQGVKLVFWRAFTFANTRVGDDFDLKSEKQTAYCPHPFTDVGVLWNGDVTLCCLDHDGQLKVGNIRDSSIESMIQNEEAKKLRGSMIGQSPLPPVCQTCQAKPIKREDDTQIIARSY